MTGNEARPSSERARVSDTCFNAIRIVRRRVHLGHAIRPFSKVLRALHCGVFTATAVQSYPGSRC